MRRCVLSVTVTILFASAAQSQMPQFPSYKSNEEYCRANPKNILCSDPNYRAGKPLDLSTVTSKPFVLSPRVTTGAAAPQRPRMDVIPIVAPGGNVDWRFAHPNAAMLMSMNVRALLASPVIESTFNQIAAQFGGNLPGLNPSELAKARSVLNNIDRVYVSMRQAGSTPQVLMVMTGRFDDAFLTAMQLNATERSRLANATAVLVGDPGSLSDAAKRMAGDTPANALVQNAGAWAARYDVWVTGNPALFPSTGAAHPAAGLAGSLASSVRSFSVGMRLSNDVRMDAVLQTTSPQVAEQLAATLRSARTQQPGMDQFGRAMQVTTNGATVQISASVDASQVSRTMGTRTSAGQRGYVNGRPVVSGAVPIPEATSNPNSKPGRVVISGLDDGPKEIPVEPKK